MRKFTLLIASLFITIGAMAQTPVLELTSEQIGTSYPYEIPEADAQNVYALTDLTVAVKVNTAAMSGRQALFCTADPTQAANSVAMGTNSFYVAYGTSGDAIGYLASWKEGDRFTKSTVPANTDGVVLVYVINPSANTCKLYVNGTMLTSWVNAHTDGFMSGYEIATPGMVKADHNNAKIYIGGGVNSSGSSEVFNGTIVGVKVFDGVLTDEQIAEVFGVEEALTYTLTDIAGNEFTGTYEGYAGESLPTFTGATGYSLTNGVWDGGTNYTATINFAYPVSNKKNGITNEVLLAQFGNKYWHAVGTNIKVQTTTVAAVDANCLWAIYPSFSEGVFTFEIMNVATGKYIHTDATAAAHNSEGTIVLSEIPTEFVINSDKDFKIADKSLYISINSTNDTDVYLGLYGNAHDGTNVTSSTLPQYDVEITDAKYATFYAPVAVTVPDGVTAHTVTINGDWATLSEPLATIPAYTGVVLYSETAQTYTFNVTTTDVTVENNDLEGTVAATYVTKDAYVLGVVDGVVGFYTAETDGQEAGTFLNNHHKAYLPKAAGMNLASYSFRFGEGTTGVEKVEIRNEKSEIYDLTGRRVESISAPGIYIVNGKKLLVK